MSLSFCKGSIEYWWCISSRLDLDAWINEPEPESDDDSRKIDAGSFEIFYKTSTPLADFRDGYQGEGVIEESEDVQQVRREARRVEQANNPHYLKGSSRARRSPSQLLSPAEEVPVMLVNPSVPLHTSSSKKLSDKYLELERRKETSSETSKKHRTKRDKKKKKKKGYLLTHRDVFSNWAT